MSHLLYRMHSKYTFSTIGLYKKKLGNRCENAAKNYGCQRRTVDAARPRGVPPSKEWAIRRRMRRMDMRDATKCDRMRKLDTVQFRPLGFLENQVFVGGSPRYEQDSCAL